MDLEPLLRSYAKSFITSADLTSLATALVGSLAALWLGKRITTYTLSKGFSLSWGAAKWLFTSRPLGDVAAAILRAMAEQKCYTDEDGKRLRVGEKCGVDFRPYSKSPWSAFPPVVHINGQELNGSLTKRERKRIGRQAETVIYLLRQHIDQLDRERLIAHLRGGTPPERTVYYKGGQVFTEHKPQWEISSGPETVKGYGTESKKPVEKQQPPTPAVTAGADGQPVMKWPQADFTPPFVVNSVCDCGERQIRDVCQGVAVPSGTGCRCDGDEECDICREWAQKAMAAADRRAPK